MRRTQRGAALLVTFLMMLVMSGLALAIGVNSHNSLVGSREQLVDKQAFYIATAGLQRARQAINAATWSAVSAPGNTYAESFGAGEYKVTIVDDGSNKYTITSEGYVPDQTNTVAKRQVVVKDIDVTTGSANLSLTATASASSSKGANTPDKANDGSTSTKWEANTQGSGEWLAMDHGSATQIDKIIIYENSNIDGVTIESSSDGSSWSTVTNLSVTESPAKTWTATFDATTEQHFRTVLTASGTKKRVGVDEFESYDTSTTATTFLDEGEFTTAW